MSCVAQSIAAMFLAWNAGSPADIRRHAEEALITDIEFVDPDYVVHGLASWVAMVETFRTSHPDARPRLASRIDAHHDRARYAWAVTFADGSQLEGVDVIAIEPTTCRIRRIDSFVGPLTADRLP